MDKYDNTDIIRVMDDLSRVVQPEILPSVTGVPYPLSDVLYTSSDSTHRVEGVTIEARNTDE